MSGAPDSRSRWTVRSVASMVVDTAPSSVGTDIAAVAIRVALTWIFVYYGAGKLFGWFDGPGIHRTALFMSETAHLHPGGFFAVLGGIIEFGGALALALGLFSRLAALALFGDQVMAMATVTWVHGINSLTATPGYEFNMALAAMAFVIVGIGAGRLSLDAVIASHLRSTAPAPDSGIGDADRASRGIRPTAAHSSR